MIRTLSRLMKRTGQTIHNALLPGFPFSYKVALNPKEFARVMTQHKIRTRAGDVTLKLGKIDSILGQYHMDTGTIEVDVLEIAMAKLKYPSAEELDREVTRTLAHELRHSWQHQNYGTFRMSVDKLVIYFGLLLPIWILFVYPAILKMVKLALTGNLLFILLAGAGIYVVMKIYRYLSFIARVVSYRYCWIERDARKFADQAVLDPSWKDVIQVEQGLTLPSHILVPDGLQMVFPTTDEQSSTTFRSP